MGKSLPDKRVVKFNELNEIVSEVQSLLDNGYQRKGNWSLGQACGHLAKWMTYPIDGFPVPPIFLRPVFWIMKVTMAKRMKAQIFAEGFKPGMPTAPESVPSEAEFDDQQGVDQLKAAVERLSQFNGELKPSPLFGPMDKATLTKVSLLHAEHHLGYLEPKT